jgi:AraC-like DNA-binding protein/quercetin dioxygenase-like cupin family protein
MKAHIQKLPLSENASFIADTFITPYFETPWHYHSEYELVLIIKGRGTRFVGNHISDYKEGNLTFIGPDVPHMFRKENANEDGGSLVIHFREDFLGTAFMQAPEMQKIIQLFRRSVMGLNITGNTATLVNERMYHLLDLQGMDRIITLFGILNILAQSADMEMLSSAEVAGQNSRDNDRLNKVFDYVMTHFRSEIKLEEIAEIVHMSYSGFCRYFKNRTKKNFIHFVNEVRIGYSCKLLLEKDVSVASACYEAGFNNLANFNEQFKKFLKLTPYQFKQKNSVY